MSEADQSIANLAVNMKTAREARRWNQAKLVTVLNEHGAETNQSAISRLEKGEREPRFQELRALLSVLGISMNALTADPADFEQTLEWTTTQGSYRDARKRLQMACDAYEMAANALLSYLQENHTGDAEDVTETLRRQARQSSAGVALETYKSSRYGLVWGSRQNQIAKGDPAYGLHPDADGRVE